MKDLLLIAGDSPVIVDLVAHASGRNRKLAVVSTPEVCGAIEGSAECYPSDGFSKADFLAAHPDDPVAGVVVILGHRMTAHERALLDAVIDIAASSPTTRVCIVSSFRVHFGDRNAARAEAYVRDRLGNLRERTAVLRPSVILSPDAPASRWLRSLSFCAPLVPARFRGCCVDGTELFDVIEQEIGGKGSRPHGVYTLLGPNRPWKARLAEHRGGGVGSRLLSLAATAMSILLVGHILGLLFSLLARFVPSLRFWDFDTLRPESTRELLALYNRYNYQHVKVVGYNNGVVHFGQRHPDRTLVSTTRCNHTAYVRGDRAWFDGGVTVRQASDVLSRAGKELPVIPNYSYVTLGTSFFVPIHGSASDFSTVADTVEKVVLYDPVHDRVIVAARGEPAFGEYHYDLQRPVLLLRLLVRVKEKSRYYVKRQTLADPTTHDLLDAFHDKLPSNVEVRKARAAAREVEVYKYYSHGAQENSEITEFPRDAVGRLWDRIERHPLSSFLFHTLMRRFGYHVELFFTAEEFVRFWETHARLPITKIQLRYIRRDGFPHSPFRDHDCVSADLFMLRKHRRAFEQYVKDTFHEVQFNPGKHSA
jgi:hypothetical protein